MLSAEQIVQGLFGQPCKNIKVNMVNVNSLATEGSTEKDQPHCNHFVDLATKFFPTIVKNFAEEVAKKKENKLAVAERFFVPFWFSPSSLKFRQHPLDFGGDHTSETLYKKMGMSATHQMFPRWTNTDLCPALASKKKFDSVGINAPKLLIPEEGYGAKEVEHCMERGICNTVGVQTTDVCRFVATYKGFDGKYNVSLICGDSNFIAGSGSIFKNLFPKIEEMRAAQENKKFNGITLPDSTINVASDMDDAKSHGVSVARMLGGAVFVHDYLCVLRDIFGVKKLVEFDMATKEEMRSVSISSAIEDFAKVKKYLAVAKALKTIR